MGLLAFGYCVPEVQCDYRAAIVLNVITTWFMQLSIVLW
nr:hypothetical protein JVH1_4243 [Rhodococcus sp. JVH1]